MYYICAFAFRYTTGSTGVLSSDRYESNIGSSSYLDRIKPGYSRLDKDDSTDFKKVRKDSVNVERD